KTKMFFKRITGRKVSWFVMAVMLVQSVLFAVPNAADAATQDHYRWRNDDGTEATATYAANEDTTYNAVQGVGKRLRFGVRSSSYESSFFNYAVDSTHALTGAQYRAVAIDTKNGYMYSGTYNSPTVITRVRLSDMTKTTLSGMVAGENDAEAAAIDVDAGFAYFVLNTNPIKVIKVDLATFTKTAVLDLTGRPGGALANALAATYHDGFLYV